MLPDIKSINRTDLETRFKDWGEPAYRAGQVLDWLYKRRVTSWDAMTNLAKPLRARLAEHFSLQVLALVRKQGADDATQKFLWRLADGALIESVLIPANPALYGEASDRHTLCVSTQVGCAYGCKFCASGLDGWKRNLGPEEIVEQVLAVERWNEENAERGTRNAESPAAPLNADAPPVPRSALRARSAGVPPAAAPNATESPARKSATPPAAAETAALRVPRLINNLVIMGMGEPLANYDHLLKALRLLNAPWGGGIGARKITISTSGLAPQIRKLAAEPEQFRLAVSLHGATDEVRTRIMPVNRKYPLAELTAALEDYQRRKDQLLTFEYILIAGVNDGLDQTRPLAALAQRVHAKVNLIPYNTVEGLEWSRPTEAVCEAFLAALERLGVTATLRREKGGDIDAACGQLRLKTERELSGQAIS